MIIFGNNNEKIRALRIINEALSEALSDVTSRSHREIWEDMIAEILAIQNPEIAVDWKEEDPDFQDEIGEEAGFSFDEFMASVAKIEHSILRVLIAHGNQPTLN